MPIRFNCPECGAVLDVPTASAGREVTCEACNALIGVPGPQLLDDSDPLSELLAAILPGGDEPATKPHPKEENGKVPPSDKPAAASQPAGSLMEELAAAMGSAPKVKPAAKPAGAPQRPGPPKQEARPPEKPARSVPRAGESPAQKPAEAPEAAPKAAPADKSGAGEVKPHEPPKREVLPAERPSAGAPRAAEVPRHEARPPQKTAVGPTRPAEPPRYVARRPAAGPLRPSGTSVREVSAVRAAASAARQAPHAARPAPVRRASNAGLGVATLLLLACGIAVFFLPWVELLVARVGSPTKAVETGRIVHTYKEMDLILVPTSPASFIINMGGISDAAGGFKSSPSAKKGAEAGPGNPAATEDGKIAGIVLLSSPFVYGVGLVVAVVGAFQILARWRSVAATFGFAICMLGCALVLAGLYFFAPEDQAAGRAATGGLIRLALTPWFYAAALVGVLGFITNVAAIVRQPRTDW
jgi:hypothetical protein